MSVQDREAYISKMEEFSTKPKLIHHTRGVKKMIALMREMHEEIKAYQSGETPGRKPLPEELDAALKLESLVESGDLYDEIDEAGQPYVSKSLPAVVGKVVDYVKQSASTGEQS